MSRKIDAHIKAPRDVEIDEVWSSPDCSSSDIDFAAEERPASGDSARRSSGARSPALMEADIFKW